MTEPRFPGAAVQLTGEDGSVIAIMARAVRALRRAGATDEEVREFSAEALSGDYDNVLATCARWADVS
jgi:hypothetical protein